MERSCELLHIRFFCMHSYVNRIVITRCRESPQPHWKRGRKCKVHRSPRHTRRLDRTFFRSQTVSREQVTIALFRCLGVFEVSTRPNSISVTVPPREAGKFSGFQGRQCRFP